MQIVIDIPEDYYKAIKEIPVEQSTADMLIIRNGTPLPKAENHGFIALCDSVDAITQELANELKNTAFVGNEDCPYCFDIMEIIDADGGDAG